MTRSPSNAALVAGQYPGQGVPPARAARHRAHPADRPGTERARRDPADVASRARTPLTLVVTGIVRARQDNSAFWTADPTAAQPVEDHPHNAAVVLGERRVRRPGRAGPAAGADGTLGISLQWAFPLTLTGVRADQAPALQGQLDKVSAQAPALQGALAPADTTMVVSSALAPILGGFLVTSAEVNSVLSLLFAGLAATAVVVILLAGWMLVQRRTAEFTVLRARGATVRQLSVLMLRGTVAVRARPPWSRRRWPSGHPRRAGRGGLVAGRAGRGHRDARAAAGGRLAVPGGPAGAPGPGDQVRAARTGQPALAGARRARRLVAELALSAAAVGGLVVLRAQGIARRGQRHRAALEALDLYTRPGAGPGGGACRAAGHAAVPAGGARPAPAVHPPRGPDRFLAWPRPRAPRGHLLPLFAVVLALTLAAFSGMLRAAVSRGQTGGLVAGHRGRRGAQRRAVQHRHQPGRAARHAAVPGVQHATASPGHPVGAARPAASCRRRRRRPGQLRGGAGQHALARAAAPPAGRADRPAGPAPGRPVPVLASPAAAAALRGSPGKLTALQGTIVAGPLRCGSPGGSPAPRRCPAAARSSCCRCAPRRAARPPPRPRPTCCC